MDQPQIIGQRQPFEEFSTSQKALAASAVPVPQVSMNGLRWILLVISGKARETGQFIALPSAFSRCTVYLTIRLNSIFFSLQPSP